MKLYEPPVVLTHGRIATLTLASLCVGKEQGGSDNTLDPSQQPGPGTDVTGVFEAGPDGQCYTADDGPRAQ